jgi:FAD-dependent oxidoreductase domain-containing protein 1
LRPIHFSTCVIAAGAFSGDIAKMAKIGCAKDILSVPLPVEPRYCTIYLQIFNIYIYISIKISYL